MAWKKELLREVLQNFESGGRPKGGVKNIETGIPSIGGEHLNSNGSFDFSNLKYVPEDFYENLSRGIIKKGDVLVVKDGATTGKTSFVGTDFPFAKAAVNEHVFLARVNQKIASKLLFYYLFSLEGQLQLKKCITGTAQGGINLSILDKILVKYPESKLEQDAIISEMEKQFTRLNEAIASIYTIREKISSFKKSILKSAFDGNLIPATFEYATIEEASKLVQYGTSKKANKEGILPVLRMGNLESGKIQYENLKFFSKMNNELKDLVLEDGDILFNRTNSAELVGKTSIFKKRTSPYEIVVFASYLIRIRVNRDLVLPDYLNYWLNSPVAQHIKNGLICQQVGQANINGTKLRNIKFPLVRDKEIQETIVHKIDSCFSLIERIEQIIDKSLLKTEVLRKSILKEAFEGNLVKPEGLAK